MDKSDLTRLDGFNGWLDFRTFVAAKEAGRAQWAQLAPPTDPGVYVFATEPKNLSKGKSEIYYIGKANNLRTRIGKHLYRLKRARTPDEYGGWVGPERSAEQGIARLVEEGRPVEIGWIVTPSIDAALRTEESLLRAYKDEHNQLPPNNRIGGSSPVRT